MKKIAFVVALMSLSTACFADNQARVQELLREQAKIQAEFDRTQAHETKLKEMFTMNAGAINELKKQDEKEEVEKEAGTMPIEEAKAELISKSEGEQKP